MNSSRQLNFSATVSLRGTAFIVVESCIFILMDIAALVGNSLVCMAFYRKPSLRTVTNYFVLSLALTDLSIAVLVMPPVTASSVANKWIAGDYGCNISHLSGYILAGTSLLTLMLLAINRYFRVARPALYINVFTKKRSVTMAVCAWLISTIVMTGFLGAGIEFETSAIKPAVCSPVFPASTTASTLFKVVQMVYIAAPSSVILVCYVKIYKIIHHQNTAATPLSHGRNSSYGVEEVTITRILTVVVVGFYLCWVPVFITTLLLSFSVIGDKDFKYHNFYFQFPYFGSSVINPIIYASLSHSFRKEFLKIVRGGTYIVTI